MTRRRWIADEFSAERAALTGVHAAHLARTLRARVGQEFEVACGDQVRRATVASVADNRVEFTLGEAVAEKPVAAITLLLAIFKFDRMEWAIEKCTELNVATIVPVVARRTEKHLALAAGKRVDRWRRIAREAAEQSRRTAIPEIADPMKLSEALQVDAILKIVLAETEREVSLTELAQSRDSDSLAIAVGPEGGWTQDELQDFASRGWLAASLGNTILRAETAAIAAMAIATANL
jgi:16S rRNA (uracil1498-N3)-methyltransferase